MKSKRLICAIIACAMAISVLTGCNSNNSTDGEKEFIKPAYVETKYGWLYGYKQDHTYIYKGIQYGLVEKRFHKAVEPEPWEGIRSALTYRETCPNTSHTVSVSSFVDNVSSDMVQNEQCLYLNVWTQSQDKNAKKPVIFFLHGGGFSSGASNELAAYDGKNLSEYGDIVFVNANHRLNYLGYTDLSAYGEEYEISGDVGMQDIVMALQWVRDNIENFGGDPSNVTLVGQSGGAVKVELLMQIPEAKDLFERAMMCSGLSIIPVGTDSETAQKSGITLVEKCKEAYGLTSDAQALEKLETMPYEQLALLADEAGVSGNPTVGGSYIPEVYQSDTGIWPEIARDKPLIVSNTFGELAGNDGIMVMPIVIDMMAGQSFNPDKPEEFLADYYKPDLTREDMTQLVKERYGSHADTIMEQFAYAYPSRDVVDVLSVNADRQASTNMCIDKARQEGAAVYNCVFAYEYPIMGGIVNYHTGGDLPFLFYNLSTREYMIQGDEKNAYKVAGEAATALIRFAYTGDPGSDQLKWPEFTVENGETMIFDNVSEVINYPDQELLKTINEAREN